MSKKSCISCGETKPTSEFYHQRGKPVGRCKTCARASAQDYREKNREKFNACVRAWRKKYPERAREADRAKRVKNPEKYREIDREKKARNPILYAEMAKRWKLRNREKVLQASRKYYAENTVICNAARVDWARRNRDRYRAAKARRRACEINAMPAWADKGKIAKFYKLAKRMSEETGTPHHVDHIVPLNSPIVCGLHCEFNLQVLPGAENVSKGNRRWPDMPGSDVWDWVASSEFKQQWKLLCGDLTKRSRPPSMWEAIPPEERSRMATERNLAAWKKRSPEQRVLIGRRIAEGQRRSKLRKAAASASDITGTVNASKR